MGTMYILAPVPCHGRATKALFCNVIFALAWRCRCSYSRRPLLRNVIFAYRVINKDEDLLGTVLSLAVICCFPILGLLSYSWSLPQYRLDASPFARCLR